MTNQFLNEPGHLFLGSSHAAARAQGARRFGSARNAVRFAMEHAAPVSLRGALLRIGDQSFGPEAIRDFHAQLIAEAV